jgi:hypothetical protein
LQGKQVSLNQCLDCGALLLIDSVGHGATLLLLHRAALLLVHCVRDGLALLLLDGVTLLLVDGVALLLLDGAALALLHGAALLLLDRVALLPVDGVALLLVHGLALLLVDGAALLLGGAVVAAGRNGPAAGGPGDGGELSVVLLRAPPDSQSRQEVGGNGDGGRQGLGEQARRQDDLEKYGLASTVVTFNIFCEGGCTYVHGLCIKS